MLLCSCTAIGFYFAARLSRRKELLQGFLSLLTSLETSLRYEPGEIDLLLRECAPKELSDCFESEAESFCDFRADLLKKLSEKQELTKDDVALVREFTRMLGATDLDGQLNHIALYKELFRQSYDNSVLELKSKAKLCKLLGFLSGSALALMII